MTSKVIVDAHAGWPVQVEVWDLSQEDRWVLSRTQVVPPMAEESFYVFDTRRLIIEEQKKDQ